MLVLPHTLLQMARTCSHKIFERKRKIRIHTCKTEMSSKNVAKKRILLRGPSTSQCGCEPTAPPTPSTCTSTGGNWCSPPGCCAEIVPKPAPPLPSPEFVTAVLGLWKRCIASPSEIFRLANVSVSASIWGVKDAEESVLEVMFRATLTKEFVKKGFTRERGKGFNYTRRCI